MERKRKGIGCGFPLNKRVIEKKKEKWNYGKSKKAAFLKQEFAIIMERYPVMRLVNVLRYNSPSKRQIRRLIGRPKWLNSKNEMDAPMALEPIKYTSKVNAPFAVFSSVVCLLIGNENISGKKFTSIHRFFILAFS